MGSRLRRPGRRPVEPLAAPVVILVRPQLPENIGAVARAMLNCGMSELRLVQPREAWPSERAREVSSGAGAVIDGATVFPSARAATADLQHVYATTARHRQMIKPVETPHAAAAAMRAEIAAGKRVGILFGPERTGLENDELVLADRLVSVPLNPEFPSLNLAQAVLVLGYEWFRSGDATPARQLVTNGTRPAERGELVNFFDHLERELVACGFLRNAEKRPSMVRNIRNIFLRADLTKQEIKTLHGIVKDLSTKRVKGSKRRPKPGA
jgi:tRNA/rRNA methyltransferase